MRLRELKGRRAAIAQRMKDLLAAAETEERELSADESAEFEGLEIEATEIGSKIAREEALLEIQRTMEPAEDLGEAPNGASPDDPPVAEPRGFGSLGEFLQAVVHGSQPGGYVDPRLNVGAATGLSEGAPSDGGFLVQTDQASGLLRRVHDTSQVWGRCRNIPISGTANGVKINAIDETSRADGSRLGGVRAYWKGEAATLTATDPKFRQIELSLKKLTGLAYATDELLADSAALESVLSDGFVEEFGFKLDDGVINGTGAGVPLGILNAGCLVTVAKETGQAAATIVAENIEKMYSRLWARSVGNAVWFINQDCWPQIFKLTHDVGTGGAPMFIRAGGIGDSPNGTLLGRPIVPIEQCATLGTTGDIILADFGQYVTATKGGIESAQSIHVKFTAGETTFRWTYRADGQPIWNAALTPYKGSNTQSPFVALATRS